MASQIKGKVDTVPQFDRFTPMSHERSTGIVSFGLPEKTAENFKDELWASDRLLVSYWHPMRLLRLSVAFFTTHSELDHALGVISAATI